MVKEIVTSCDSHLARGESAPGVERRIRIDGLERTLDLCDGCREELLGPVLRLLESHGARLHAVAAPKGASGASSGVVGPVPVRVCLWCPDTFESDSGLTTHLKTKHGAPKTANAVWLWGSVCPVCGWVNERQGSTGYHVGQNHREIGHISSCFAWARDNGDPHGAYADLIKRLPG